jgi:hypothetical protein
MAFPGGGPVSCLCRGVAACGHGILATNLLATPHRMWVCWVMAGWGTGLLAHAAWVCKPWDVRDPRWERRQVEKRLGHPL